MASNSLLPAPLFILLMVNTVGCQEDAQSVADGVKKVLDVPTLLPGNSCEEDTIVQVILLLASFTGGIIATSLVFITRPIVLPEVGPVRWKRIVLATFFMCFLISIPWEWYKLFKEAVAEREAQLTQQMPEECKPNKTKWAAVTIWMRHTFTFDDERCVEYHKALMVDPFWDVSPFQAFSVCAARFFLEPISASGEAFGELFRGFFKHVPAQLFLPVFIAAFLLILMTIISFSGFTVSTPLFRIGTRGSSDTDGCVTKEGVPTNCQLLEEIHQLRVEIRALSSLDKANDEARKLPIVGNDRILTAKMFAKADLNSDGVLDAGEFAQMLAEQNG